MLEQILNPSSKKACLAEWLGLPRRMAWPAPPNGGGTSLIVKLVKKLMLVSYMKFFRHDSEKLYTDGRFLYVNDRLRGWLSFDASEISSLNYSKRKIYLIWTILINIFFESADLLGNGQKLIIKKTNGEIHIAYPETSNRYLKNFCREWRGKYGNT